MFGPTCLHLLLTIYQELEVTPSIIATEVPLGTANKILD